MPGGVILMVVLRLVERAEGHHLGHDRTIESLRVAELLDVRGRGLFLLFRRVENRRSVLRAYVRSLPVELRRVVDDGEEDLEQGSVRDFRRVEDHANRLRVTRASR